MCGESWGKLVWKFVGNVKKIWGIFKTWEECKESLAQLRKTYEENLKESQTYLNEICECSKKVEREIREKIEGKVRKLNTKEKDEHFFLAFPFEICCLLKMFH